MKYYPIHLNVQNRACLVVGGGSVGTRKALTLLECGARVSVVSPELSDPLLSLSDEALTLKRKSYESKDLDGAFLVIGATDDEALNQRIHSDAEARNMLCNIADRPASCNFILPSIIRRGDLVITVSTSGNSPAYAKNLRTSLEGLFGEEQAVFLTLMGRIREKLLQEDHEPEFHKPVFEALIHSDLLEKIRENDVPGMDAILFRILGKGYGFELLMDEREDEKP